MKFYPADWRSDEALRSCSIAARGLWVEMMALMHVAEPYGSLLVKGKRPDKKRLAALAGIPEKECTSLLLELEGMAVFARDPDGTIYSRRMRRDFEKAAKDKENGKVGGNPQLKGGVNPPDKGEDKAQIPEARIADAGDARAKPPLVSPEAQQLADELLVIAGHKLEFIPPGWCGAAMRVQAWLAEWPREIIVAAVKGAAARKRGAPANSVQFFENAVAEEFARQSAPLPNVEIREAKTLTVTHGPSQNRPGSSLIAALDRRIAEAEIAEQFDPALPAGSVLSLPNRSVR